MLQYYYEEEQKREKAAKVQEAAEARAKLQGMLDALESRQPMPTGPELAAALRMCRIGA